MDAAIGDLAQIRLDAVDADAATLRHLALEAKRAALIDVRMSGDIVDMSFDRLDPGLAPTGGTISEGVA